MVNLYAWKNHNHAGADINSGTIDIARMPANLPLGVVLYAEGPTFSDTTVSSTTGFGEVAFTPVVNRLYCVTWQPPHAYVNTSTASAQYGITRTTDGTRPLVTSTTLRWEQMPIATTGALQSPPPISYHFSVSSTPSYPHRFLGIIGRVLGSGTLLIRALSTDPTNPWWKIEDLGPSSNITGNAVVSNNGL